MSEVCSSPLIVTKEFFVEMRGFILGGVRLRFDRKVSVAMFRQEALAAFDRRQIGVEDLFGVIDLVIATLVEVKVLRLTGDRSQPCLCFVELA